MRLGLFVHANILPQREFKRQIGVVAQECERLQIMVDHPFGFENLAAYAKMPSRKDLALALHAPFMYVDCLSLDEDHRRLSLRRVFETLQRAKALDAEGVVIHLGKVIDAAYSSKRYLPVLQQSLDELSDVSHSEGVRLLIENLPPGKKSHASFPCTQPEIEEVLSRCGRLGMCVDIGHVTRAKLDLRELLNRLGDRLGNVHIHDSTLEKDHLAYGEGVVDFARALGAFENIHYQGGLDVEIMAFSKALATLHALKNIGFEA